MDRLKNLQRSLEELNLKAEAEEVSLLKLSWEPSDKQLQFNKKQFDELDPKVLKGGTHIILDMLGIIPGAGEIADLANAGLYLSEGVTITSTFNAAVSIVSMVSGFGDASKIAKYVTKAYKVSDLKFLKPIAQKIMNHQGQIQSVFTRLKSNEVTKRISDIPHGDLLVKHSDDMFKMIISWAAELLLNTADKGLQALIQAES